MTGITMYGEKDIRHEVRTVKSWLRRSKRKPRPGWYLRVNPRGASLVVEYEEDGRIREHSVAL